MDQRQPKDQRDGRPLFGTLLASNPASTRSPQALAISIVLHVAFLALLALFSRPFVPKLAHKLFQPITIIIPEEESTIVTLSPVIPDGRPAPPRPNKVEERRPDDGLTLRAGPIAPIQPAAPGPVTAEPSDAGPSNPQNAPRSLTERLMPRAFDPRLSPRGSFVPTDLSPAAAVRERIAEALALYNDSASAETEARRRALDWTRKTKDGKVWGVGPDGRIHLGDITLPRVAFSAPPGKRDEINARNRDWAEIEAMASREIGRHEFKDRVKAIRARKDKERQEKKKDAGSTPITN